MELAFKEFGQQDEERKEEKKMEEDLSGEIAEMARQPDLTLREWN